MNKPCGELFRDPNKGKIAGVCAGIAQYLGWETWLVRILVVSGVLLGMEWFIVVYIAGWFILDKKSVVANKAKSHTNKNATDNCCPSSFTDDSIKVKTRIWQAGEPPKQAFHDIRRKFKGLERQLRSMEKYVTSAEFTVSREINKL
jgi:phage shock protein C